MKRNQDHKLQLQLYFNYSIWETSHRVFTPFLAPKRVYSCFYNSIQTWKMFSGFLLKFNLVSSQKCLVLLLPDVLNSFFLFAIATFNII